MTFLSRKRAPPLRRRKKALLPNRLLRLTRTSTPSRPLLISRDASRTSSQDMKVCPPTRSASKPKRRRLKKTLQILIKIQFQIQNLAPKSKFFFSPEIQKLVLGCPRGVGSAAEAPIGRSPIRHGLGGGVEENSPKKIFGFCEMRFFWKICI